MKGLTAATTWTWVLCWMGTSGSTPFLRVVCSVVFLICFGLRAGAVVAQHGDAESPVLEIGDTVTVRGVLDAWENYPSGYSMSRGDRVVRIRPGEVHEVIGLKAIPSVIWGASYYVRVRPVGTLEHECRLRPCWVYQGRDRVGPPWNLEAAAANVADPVEPPE